MIDKGLYWHPTAKPLTKQKTYVGNTVFMLANCLFSPVKKVNGKTFYLIDYPSHTIQEWANDIQVTLNKKEIKVAPMWLLRLGGYMGDFLKLLGFSEQKVPLTSFRLNNMLTEVNCPNDRIKELCQELPYSSEDGVRITAQWLYERGDISNMPVDKNN